VHTLLHLGSGKELHKGCHVHDMFLRKDLPTVLTLPEEALPSTTEQEAPLDEEHGLYDGLQMQIADSAAGGINEFVAPDEQNALGATHECTAVGQQHDICKPFAFGQWQTQPFLSGAGGESRRVVAEAEAEYHYH
jgi:hypothetical protein